jgi:membrane associated rhomboid family serine protease
LNRTRHSTIPDTNPEPQLFFDSPFTLFLLLINVLVSGYALYFDPSLINTLSFRPKRILKEKEYYRMLTGGFVHGGLGHLAFNMFTLFFFGPVLETSLGSAEFLIIFFGAEFAAHGFTLWKHRDSSTYAAVGASGAISGVVVSFSLLYPTYKIYLMLIPIGIPAWLFALGFIGFSAYAMNKRDQSRMGGIAHEAHLGGAIGGLLLTLVMVPSALGRFTSQMGF